MTMLFFNTFLEEHDFRYLLEVKLIFDRESFGPTFIIDSIFIFGLDFNIMKNIRIGDRKVVDIKSEMFMFHLLQRIVD